MVVRWKARYPTGCATNELICQGLGCCSHAPENQNTPSRTVVDHVRPVWHFSVRDNGCALVRCWSPCPANTVPLVSKVLYEYAGPQACGLNCVPCLCRVSVDCAILPCICCLYSRFVWLRIPADPWSQILSTFVLGALLEAYWLVLRF